MSYLSTTIGLAGTAISVRRGQYMEIVSIADGDVHSALIGRLDDLRRLHDAIGAHIAQRDSEAAATEVPS